MKQVAIWFVVLILVLGFVWYIQKNGLPARFSRVQPTPQENNPTLTIGDKVTVTIEIADTPEKQVQGLSGRDPLLENYGMLFPFPAPRIATFWMKDMKFDLDMIWIGENNTIVDIHENVPAPTSEMTLSDLPYYSPKVPAKMVLEVNAGFVEKNSVVVGDSVTLQTVQRPQKLL